MIKRAILTALVALSIALPLEAEVKGMSSRVLFMMRRCQVQEAVDLYRQYALELGREDYDILQQMGLVLLEQGANSRDAEEQLMAIFGAGVSAHDLATPILVQGLNNDNPQIRLASLNMLAQRQTDTADELINRAINCQEPLIRLEGCYLLAKKKHPAAVGQTEALMIKLPPATWFLFAEIFATIGDVRSIRQLRRLMNHEDNLARLAAIVAVAEHGRDDLLPQIRQLSTHLDTSQQEACAGALGALGDQGSISRLKKLAESKAAHVRLAAYIALNKLGCTEYAEQITALAREGNVLAIYALGDVEGSQDLLATLADCDNSTVQINATLSLLRLRDRRCLPGLRKLLIKNRRDTSYVKVVSHGKILTAWKAVPTATLESTPLAIELSTNLRESCLGAAVELPEEDFLELAEAILDKQQCELVPLAIQLIENIASDKAIAILQKHQQKLGAPLVRNYCNLALFKLDVEGPYSDNLLSWVRKQSHVDMIRFRPVVPWELRDAAASHQITPEETSKLFISSVETLAARQDDSGVQVLLDLIRDGNAKNRYALAGLLIRTIQ
ncbi:MAG: HEAT repeat domain-containing protein [Chlamydiales bacterium]|nr:HEAT repeat domain-containing protein [Chlamydiales bacterium]